MGIRRTIGRIGVHTSLFGVGSYVRLLARRELRILAYHRIIDPNHAYDSENVSADLENFDWQMRYMRKNYDVISFQELKSIIESGDVLPKRCAMITFDDGFADNYFNAFPILKELGMPALFSVITSMVGTEEMFWFDRAACLVKRAQSGQTLKFGSLSMRLDDNNRETHTACFLQFLKDQPDHIRREFIEQIDVQLAPLLPSSAELAPHFPLNWDQIRLMSDAGMEIGSHTHSHPILAKLPSEESIVSELSTSKSIIESHTDGPCLVVSYPEGLDYAIDERVDRAAETSGFDFGLTSIRGVNSLPMGAKYRLDRIQVHHSNDRTLFQGSVQFPEIVV